MNLRSNQSNRVGAVVSLAAPAFAVVPVSHASSFTRAASKNRQRGKSKFLSVEKPSKGKPMKHILSACALTYSILIIILSPMLTGAQTVVEEWVRIYGESVNHGGQAHAVAVDTNGNVFVTGFYWGGANNDLDYLTIKYSSAGAALWTNRYNGPKSRPDMANAIAVDKNGDVLVTGLSQNSSLSDISDTDYATTKYSGTGVPLWTNRYTGPVTGGYDEARAIAVDAKGDVFVTGNSQGKANSLDRDYATVKYSGTNGAVLWTKTYTRTELSIDRATAIAVDGSGDVFVTGTSEDYNGGNAHVYVTLKYSGTKGDVMWAKVFYELFEVGHNPADSSFLRPKMVVDSSGNALVTGAIWSYFGDWDYATIKYSGTAGDELWSQFYDGLVFGPTSYDDCATAIVVGTDDNVFVTGYSAGSGTTRAFATIAYEKAMGTPLWTNRYYGNGYATAIGVDARNNVFVTGVSAGSGTNYDFATIAYSGATGVPLWTNRFNGQANGDDAALAMAVDSSGNVFVTGFSAETNGFYDYATIKYPFTPTDPYADFGYMSNGGAASITNYSGIGGAVIIPSSINNLPVTSIAAHAFYQRSSVTSVTIPTSVTFISDYAFAFCTNLCGAYFQGNQPAIGGSHVFSGDTRTTVYYLPRATGWGTTFGGRPAVLWNPQAQTSGTMFGVQTNRFGFNISGRSNLVIVVEACTNLVNPVWSRVSTLTLDTVVGTNGTSYFSDPQWTNYPARFYRLRSP